ncbi:hypothetical protein CLOM_g6645 [Closterium sp. NIES-68]|nr:hypothetical protein CLOM_g6645 [Closterium sp. NIES-68]GJP75901.1 hypothetical protein CLOP_g6303 [Closterium sp. NIES-67]
MLDATTVELGLASAPAASSARVQQPNAFSVLMSFFLMGFYNFGGSKGHIEMMRKEFVDRRGWLDDNQFAEVYRYANAIPGPTGMQMVATLGTLWLGTYLGGILMLFIFMLPGCVSIYFVARFVEVVGQNDFFSFNAQWFTEFGPQIPPDEKAATLSQAVVGVVAAAPAYALLYSFAHAQNLSTTTDRALVAIVAVIFFLLVPHRLSHLLVPLCLLLAALLRYLAPFDRLFPPPSSSSSSSHSTHTFLAWSGGKSPHPASSSSSSSTSSSSPYTASGIPLTSQLTNLFFRPLLSRRNTAANTHTQLSASISAERAPLMGRAGGRGVNGTVTKSPAFSEGDDDDEEESKKLGRGVVVVGGVAGGLGDGGGAGIAAGDSLVVLRAKVHSLPWSVLLFFGWMVTCISFLYCRTHDGRDLGWLVLSELICRSVSLGFGGDFFPFAMMNMEYLQANGILRPPVVNILALAATIMLPGHYYSAVTFIAVYSIGMKGLVVGLMAVAVPTFLASFSLLPFWDSLQRDQGLGAAMAGASLAGTGVEIAVFLHLLLQVATTAGPLAVAILTTSLVAAFQTPAPIAMATGSAFGLILYLFNIGGPYCWVPAYMRLNPEMVKPCLLLHNLNTLLFTRY